MVVLRSLLFAFLLSATLHGQSFGNATCKGHIPDNPATPALHTRHCTFLIGDPSRVDQLNWITLPVGERLLVLGTSAALEGMDHGSTWYLVKTRDNRQGYVPEYDLQCTVARAECDSVAAKAVP